MCRLQAQLRQNPNDFLLVVCSQFSNFFRLFAPEFWEVAGTFEYRQMYELVAGQSEVEVKLKPYLL